MKRVFWLAALMTATAAGSNAQIVARGGVLDLRREDPDAARIGVYLGDNGLRDTLGVLVREVIEGGPAEQAGIKEGDRIVSIDGVNLRMTRMDAEDPMLRGMMARRLTRTLDDKRAGDEVELRVLSGSNTRTVRVKTVAARELNAMRERSTSSAIVRSLVGGNRAVLGLTLGGTPSKRDTLGVLVIGLTPDGPAEKAGLIEGDRIARINDVDVRVPREDAGDALLSQSRITRLSREISELEVGDRVTLTVVSGGRERQVELTTVRAGDLRTSSVRMFNFGDDAFMWGGGALVWPGRERIVLPQIEELRDRMEELRVRIPEIVIPRIETRTWTMPSLHMEPMSAAFTAPSNSASAKSSSGPLRAA